MENPDENEMNEAVRAPDLENPEAPVPEEAEELEAIAPSEPSVEMDEADLAAKAAAAAEAERTDAEEAGAEPDVTLAPEPVEPEPEGAADAEEVAEPAAEAEIEDDAVAPEAESDVTEEEPVIELPDVEPAAEAPAELEATPEPVEVAPELAAEVEEALAGVEAAAAEGEEAEEEVLDEWIPGEWFVVHTYAGYENKVKVDLETRVTSMNMEDKIYEIVIPMEDVVEIKGGKKQTVQRKVFPGYLLVRMDMDDDSWYVVRNTPGVTGFVGSGTKPIPLSEKEVGNILGRGKGEEAGEKPKPRAEWQPGDPVRVTTGPFANFQGVINDVDGERQKVKVLVNIFGRETPVELAFDQISKV